MDEKRNFLPFERDKDVPLVLIAGNPNVGKSTVFNALTGMKQHTGNWPGKTVMSAYGYVRRGGRKYMLADTPGTYSLMAHSPEEAAARDSLCFSDPDLILVVADATTVERNLNLLFQISELTDRLILAVNLMDEAERRKISVNIPLLEKTLGIPVVGISARNRKSVGLLSDKIDSIIFGKKEIKAGFKPKYSPESEKSVRKVENAVSETFPKKMFSRFAAIALLEGEGSFAKTLGMYAKNEESFERLREVVKCEREKMRSQGIEAEKFAEEIAGVLNENAAKIAKKTVGCRFSECRDRKIDSVLTSKAFGIPAMLALLFLCFWLTVVGAGYPSRLLSDVLMSFRSVLSDMFAGISLPEKLTSLLVDGMYTTLAFVVSVMLPPMAIFFPLFAFLEDIGYLPRIAYNLDKPFKCCRACGKQSLTMCMGFGCNAAGVVGCRIIDSERERMLAMLTNSFIPCNGRLPALLALIGTFFVGFGGILGSFVSAAFLTLLILFSIGMTFVSTKLLSKTFLSGKTSSFALELPPYRRPSIINILVRSLFDKTLKLLMRAVAVSLPAGAVIWMLANVTVGDVSLIRLTADFFDPLGRFLGMDGVLLSAFLLGFPANETVLPIAMMIYTSAETFGDGAGMAEIGEILRENGMTSVNAVCIMLFSMMHWPCSTTLMTIKKESGGLKWTLLAALLPTLFGVIACALVNLIF